MTLSLRAKLIGSSLTVIVICGATAALVGVRLVETGVLAQAQEKVGLDLNSARVIYRHAVDQVGHSLHGTSIRYFLRDALADEQVCGAREGLEDARLEHGLDFLTVVDEQGRVLLRTRNRDAGHGGVLDNPVVRRALSARTVVASTEIIPREALLEESAELASRALTSLIETPMAKTTHMEQETSGMAIVAAAPILDARGELLGALYGGRLLNRDHDLVDTIKNTVYRGEVYEGKDMGTATIFMGDVRIATNVKTAEGERAVGTRVSREVHDRVLGEEKPWVERAFVVDDWYITAYEPVRDLGGNVIGMLYVGMLEQKFTDMKREALVNYLEITFGGVLLSLLIGYLLTDALTRPIHALTEAARKLAAGQLGQRVEIERGTPEIDLLAEVFNAMAASVEDRDAELRRRAQEEIMKSERLAMIGRLSAGVAHEINNPLGGILLHSRLLLDHVPPESEARDNAERVVRGAEQCRKIVQGLLDFAHQRAPVMAHVNLNTVVEKALLLIEGQSIFRHVKIVRELAESLPPVDADEPQMIEVFVNVMVNAGDAMDGTGTLTIRTRSDPGARRVEVSFTDTGSGIPEESLPHVFEPFFTTKEVGRGTGLGLSISHGIVEKHGGAITVSSSTGEGTTIVVSLPVESGAG